jgi:hypothetical protein
MGTARRPAVRTSNAKDYLDFLARFHPAVHRHVKVTVPQEILDLIENGVRTDWIPVELDGQYVDAVFKFMGHDAMKAASRQFLAQTLIKSPMMRSLFDGALRVFGVNAGSLLKVLPSGFRQSYQDAFELRIDRGDREALVAFEDIAPELLHFPAYAVIWEGLFLGIYDLAKAEPQLEFKVLRGARRVEARFRW